MKSQIAAILSLKNSLQQCHEDISRIAYLDTLEGVLAEFPSLNLKDLTKRQEYLVKLLIALGQLHVFEKNAPEEDLKKLFETLDELEVFYATMGGLAGYQWKALELLQAHLHNEDPSHPGKFIYPPCFDFQMPSTEGTTALEKGIVSLPLFAEIYPLGGAGDRLNLIDDTTGEPLPAAMLTFMGKTLVELLIRDLEGREYLYYKLTGNKTITPIVCMTSHEKNNHQHILKLCEDKHWFGRPADSFRFMMQPSVPLFTEQGKWILKKPLTLYLKPGGHGVIWKMAKDQGMFAWLKELGYPNVIVRQINNPLAGTDDVLLKALGIASLKNWSFGFVSCPCRPNAAEGVDVLIERPREKNFEYSLTNIEYTEFAKHSFSAISFPANTNILIANIEAVEKAISHKPIPGMLVNLKSIVKAYVNGKIEEVKSARVESTMQNIADDFTFTSPHELTERDREKLPTFITLNERFKTISVNKKSYVEGQSIQETPVEAFLTKLKNAKELLEKYCYIQCPPLCTEEQFIDCGPSFYFDYSPSLGPLFHIIGQKMRKGKFSPNASLILEIAELDMENLHLQGAMKVVTSNLEGKCIFKNCRVQNKGSQKLSFHDWKEGPSIDEYLSIHIQGDGEFRASNVTFIGNLEINVAAGEELSVHQDGDGKLIWEHKAIDKPTWSWVYRWKEDHVELKSEKN